MNESLPDLIRRAARLRRDGHGVMACLVVRARGSTPQAAGALMLVDENAQTWGTIGGGCVEAEVRRRALPLLAAGRSGVMTFKLDHDYGWDDGLICGGTIELAVGPLPDAAALDAIVDDLEQRRATALVIPVESEDGPVTFRLDLPPRERLYIAGAGHVGQAVARLAATLDFDVTLFDDRPDLLEMAAPAHTATQVGEIAANLAAAPIDEATCCLIVTRGHRHDEQALAAVIGRGAGYVGMIGSRRKVKLIFDDLRERGVAEEALADVRAPVGLDIGAVSVEEIAVSIAAQLVEQRRATRRQIVSGPHPVEVTAPGGARLATPAARSPEP